MNTYSCKTAKGSPLTLRMVLFIFVAVFGVYVCSVCLKQISQQKYLENIPVSTGKAQTDCALHVPPTAIPYIHFPQPKTFSRRECSCTPVRFFVLLSMQRSGSGWFETLLNNHPNISSNGEIFSVKERRSNITTILRTLDAVYSLDWLSSAAKNECVAAVGFKWMLNQGLMNHHDDILKYFKSNGVSVIFLFRRNLLRMFISVLANNYDRHAKQLNGTHKSHVHSKEEAEILAQFKPKWGLLMASISEDNGEETPLQVRLNGVATLIGIVGLAVAAFVLVVLLVRYFTGHSKNPDGTIQFVKGHTSVKEAFNGVVKILTVAVTIVVVAVPEGLPLAVTLTLAYSMRKMMRDKALVRRLSACETMGSATTICSDKTGTLTLNQMTVVDAYVGGKKIVPPDNVDMLSSAATSMLIEGIAQNTTGNVFEPEDGEAIEVNGSPTEKAILSWGVKLGMRFNDARSKSSILHVFPFNSEKKRGGVAVEVGDSEVHVHWKGAAELVLASCTNWLDADGYVQPMTSDQMDEFMKSIEDMAECSLRCVAFSYRLYDLDKVPGEEERINWVLPEDDLILLGIVGIKDPCRPGVKDAVKLCTDAGVKVRMVTGDNVKTARAIALECGILNSEADATEPTLIEGRAFREMSDKERELVAEKISVMGRSSPNDKLLLVQALKRRGHVVAVTGDGTNDAPALHEADIGLSMGISGTEVAKESSDIIILDDNFASVVKVVRWGRSVYANIQKFIQFQLTVNVAAIVINVVAAVSSGDVPLTTVQLLWINLIMDTLGALALATEPPTDNLMKRPPVGRREPLITNIMWRNLVIQAAYQVIVLLVLNFAGTSLLGLKNDPRQRADRVKNTLIFNAFVFCQVFNEFNARKPDELNMLSGVTKSRLFMMIIGITVVFQILIIEFLGKFFKTVRLSWKLWVISLGIAFVSWPLALVGKLIPVPKIPLGEFCKRCCGRKRKDEDETTRQGDAAV